MIKMILRSLLLLPFFQIPAFGATLSAPPTGTAGEFVEVSYSGDGDAGDRMTIGDSKGLEIQGTNPANLSGEGEGTIELLMPETAGTYTILYLGAEGVLASERIEVVLDGEKAEVVPLGSDPIPAAIEIPREIVAGLRFQVDWTGPTEPRDRLVVVDPTSADPLEPISYTYLDPLNQRAILSAPLEAGSYAVLYIDGAGTILARRNALVSDPPIEKGDLIVGTVVSDGYGESTAVQVILDASGSMLQEQAGEDRIDIAKAALLKTMRDGIAPGTPFALRAFGHIEESSCESELLIPLSPLDPIGMAPIVKDIEAINLAKTPLAASLQMVASDLSEATGDQIIILITDGKETCDGDPAKVIRELRRANPLVRVSIVGYSIADQEIRSDFESWATIGGGRYFDAPASVNLEAAFQQAFAIPYVVYSGTRLVATGETGHSVTSLPPGDYTVAFRHDGQDLVKPVSVIAGQSTSLLIP